MVACAAPAAMPQCTSVPGGPARPEASRARPAAQRSAAAQPLRPLRTRTAVCVACIVARARGWLGRGPGCGAGRGPWRGASRRRMVGHATRPGLNGPHPPRLGGAAAHKRGGQGRAGQGRAERASWARISPHPQQRRAAAMARRSAELEPARSSAQAHAALAPNEITGPPPPRSPHRRSAGRWARRFGPAGPGPPGALAGARRGGARRATWLKAAGGLS